MKYWEEFVDWAMHYVPRIALAAVLLVLGWLLIKRLQKILHNAIERSHIDNEASSFLQSIVGIALKFVLLMVIVPVLGLELSALVGILAAIGFAIGLALQGFLGNFASGLTIVFFKPYRVGDWVEISEMFGKVKAIQIFNTILTTPGDKTLVIPNGQVTDNIITNFSTEGRIRLELIVPMGYEQDFPKVKGVIETALASVNHILMEEPKAHIGIESYDTHYINLTVRPYIAPDDFWEATFLVNQAIKRELSKAGVTMAYSEGVENGPIGG
ncbi:MAG: mechanosensitive ion channel family protein [Bacteroidota bacterium]